MISHFKEDGIPFCGTPRPLPCGSKAGGERETLHPSRQQAGLVRG
jgi:hypothetical protein